VVPDAIIIDNPGVDQRPENIVIQRPTRHGDKAAAD
jgi:hypothetical protein